MKRSRKIECCEGLLARFLSFLLLPLIRVAPITMTFLIIANFGLITLYGAEARPLLVLGDSHYPPIAFLEDGTPKGIDVDLAKALSRPMNREVRVELMDWNLAQEKVQRGEADGLIGISMTPERLTRFDFAEPTFTREFSFVVREGDLLIRDLSDCKNKKVGVTPGGFPRRFLEDKGLNLVLVRNYTEAFEELKVGKIDVFAADLWVAAYLMEKSNVRGLMIVEKPFTTAVTAIAVRKGNTELVNEINQALAKLRAEGKLSEIEARWKPQEMLFFSRARIRRLIVQASGALLAVLVGSMALWIVTLRKQVRIRKNIESALRDSESRLRMLADASFEGIAVCQDGIIVDVNDQILKILQYERSELIGKPVVELVAPESREVVRRAVECNLTVPYEHLAVRKNGTLVPVEVCGRTISTTPHLVRVTAVRDIEERKQAEEHLKLLQTITMNVAAVGDLTSALEVVLRRVCDRTGWVLGQAWMPAENGKELNCCPAFFAAAPGLDAFRKVSGQCSMEAGVGLPGRVFQSKKAVWIQDVTKDPNFPRLEEAKRGGIKAALGVPILSDRGEVIAVLEFFLREPREEDKRLVEVISAVAAQIGLVINRKRAEEALRKSEEKFSRFFALAPAAMAVTAPNSEGRFLDVNREFTRLSGFSHDEAVGRTTTELGVFADPGARHHLLKMFAEHGGVKEMELQFRTRNGTLLTGRYAAQLIELQGQIVALSAFVDVTRSKEAEEEIRRSREELRALAGRLVAVREEERTRIAREIHDVLAQELTRFKIDLGWLGRRLRNGALEGEANAVQEKVDNLNKLADTTIATVQKIAAELRPVVLDSLGLSAAIEWQAEEFQNRTGIRCEAIVPEEGIQLDRESATGLFRILQESLTNVVRHANATHVDIILDVDGDTLRLEVQDNGVGFDRAKMKDDYSLGLLGMRERALLLDGKFEIQGTPGRGTRVSVTMPLPRATVAHPKPSEEQLAVQ